MEDQPSWGGEHDPGGDGPYRQRPGESKARRHGINCRAPSTGAPVFIDGEKALTLRGAGHRGRIQALVQDYIERRRRDRGALDLTRAAWPQRHAAGALAARGASGRAKLARCGMTAASR